MAFFNLGQDPISQAKFADVVEAAQVEPGLFAAAPEFAGGRAIGQAIAAAIGGRFGAPGPREVGARRKAAFQQFAQSEGAQDPLSLAMFALEQGDPALAAEAMKVHFQNQQAQQRAEAAAAKGRLEREKFDFEKAFETAPRKTVTRQVPIGEGKTAAVAFEEITLPPELGGRTIEVFKGTVSGGGGDINITTPSPISGTQIGVTRELLRDHPLTKMLPDEPGSRQQTLFSRAVEDRAEAIVKRAKDLGASVDRNDARRMAFDDIITSEQFTPGIDRSFLGFSKAEGPGMFDRPANFDAQKPIKSIDESLQERGYVKGKGKAPKTGVFGSLPPGVTEEDIQFTMKQHGLTREEVIKRLRGQ